MKLYPTAVARVLLMEPDVFGDSPGLSFESFNQRVFREVTGIDMAFVQDNHSRSCHGALRGLHYQIQHVQGTLIRVVCGRIYDVAVDLRRASRTFGHWVGTELSADNHRQMWIPPGCAHGFLVLSDSADVVYKTTEYCYPEYQRCIYWNDPVLGVAWPLSGRPVVSAMDTLGVPFAEAEVFE